MRLDALHGQRVYLDSNALIYAMEGDPARQPVSVTALMRAISSGQVLAYASLLVRAEVLVMPVRKADKARVKFYRRLFDAPAPLRSAPLTATVADASARLRAQHPALRLIDALHLAAAQESACKFFLSADQHLRAAAKGRITIIAYEDLD
ncbi:MAG TPA: PIN domain-containing protein [Rhodanobacteraceae bacterium]|nr:PIN domain-containing protein [Rhodanobacteraceae bacterium]